MGKGNRQLNFFNFCFSFFQGGFVCILQPDYVPLHALPLRLARRYQVPDVPLSRKPLPSGTVQCGIKGGGEGTHQVRHVPVPLELGARKGPRLGASLEVGDALRGADDGAVEGKRARALDELVPLACVLPPISRSSPTLLVPLASGFGSCRGRRTCSSERAAPGKREGLLEKRRDWRTRCMGGGGLESLVRDRTGISLPLIQAGNLPIYGQSWIPELREESVLGKVCYVTLARQAARTFESQRSWHSVETL